MDYCTLCRRHLNGALVCPGCGAYAPDIAPRGTAAAPVAAGTAAWQSRAEDTWHDSEDTHVEETTERTTGETTEEPYDGPDAASSAANASLGRAARRRQRARWKKNQRRAVVATAVALVGGGLTVASMNGHTTSRAQAATAPDNSPMGAVDGQAAEPTEPPAATPAPTGRHRAPDRTTDARPVTANTPREQTTGVPRAAGAHRQDSAVSARPTTASAAQAQSATTSGTSGTSTASGTSTSGSSAASSAPAATSTPAAPAAGSTPASPANPAPAATSSSQLCLLVLCVG